MADEEELHRCVSKFMIETCRCTSSNRYAGHGLVFHHDLESIHGSGKVTVANTGSSAEFYIDPILRCVDDVDMMYCYNDSIAIQAGQSPPSELPVHFPVEVGVYEIEDSDWPGYVYLRLSYILKRGEEGHYTNIGKLQLNRAPHQRFLSAGLFMPFTSVINSVLGTNVQRFDDPTAAEIFDVRVALEKHGPATLGQCHLYSYEQDLFEGVDVSIPAHVGRDYVSCVRCLSWPVQAADWPTRYRENGWPVSATIDMVVSNGCDVVQAVHPFCRQDNWMSENQRRLSFSRAEVTLLNSWTQIQQIIYHMLRFVIKKEIISPYKSEFPNVSALSNYHIKTLMLWACEQKPQSWWSPESCVVKLCSKLMQELADMVSDKRCSNYFISNCNIADHFATNVTRSTCERLKAIAEESVLLHWFMDSYVRKCVQEYPEKLSLLLKDIRAKVTLEKATIGLDSTIDGNPNAFGRQLARQYLDFCFIEQIILVRLQMTQGKRFDFPSVSSLTNRPIAQMNPSPVNCRRFYGHSVALASLHVAYKISIDSVTDDMLEFLCELYEPCLSGIGDSNAIIIEPAITGALMKAIHLAKTSIACRNSTERLHVEMSKAILHHSLLTRGEDRDHTPTDCMTHIMLALLYYNSGNYHRATGHCNRVLCHYGPAQCELRRVEADYLTGIDTGIDSMLGLSLLYQHVLMDALQPGRSHDVQLVFTTALLAHYIITRSAMRVEKTDGCSAIGVCQMKRSQQCLVRTEHLLVTDVLLHKVVELHLDSDDETSVVDTATAGGDNQTVVGSDANNPSLVLALEQVALEKLVYVRNIGMQEVNPTTFKPINEFELLYLYKCSLLDECLRLCRINLDNYLRHRYLAYNVYVIYFPELLSLLDGELVSLFGIIRLLQAQPGPQPNILLRWICNVFSSMPYVYIGCSILSLYLYVKCQEKLRNQSLRETLRLVYTVYVECCDEMIHLEQLLVKLVYRLLKLRFEHYRNAS